MKPRIRFILYYFGFWLAYFLMFRAVFLLYHFSQTKTLTGSLILGIFQHGFRMDLSFTAYLCLLVFLTVAGSVLLSSKIVAPFLRWFTLVVLVFITFLSVADLELFTEWGFRLDATPLTYISTPKEMAISASSSPFILLIASIIAITGLCFWVYRKSIHPIIMEFPLIHPASGLLFLFLTAALIIPMRGGLQLAALNQSVAFFSKDDYANQAALNVPWNVFRSITQKVYSKENPYKSLPYQEAENLVRGFYRQSNDTPVSLLNTARPNIIVVLWESLTSKASPKFGGKYQGVLPELEQLVHEGILFENFYASGDRSDKGIVSLFSGYPAQPKRSIIKTPNKSAQLPVFTHSLIDQGYHTSFYHGGELEFANIKTYLVHGKFDVIRGKDSFNSEDMNSKWGAHDHVVFQKALQELRTVKEPFLSTIFTLSSHEPFEIPIASKFPGNDLESLYLSSLYYTDQSLGRFIDEIKKYPWYENTLVIVLADHGHRLLNDQPRYQKDKYHVPMLWFGGALAVRDTVISKYCSQTDVAKTLLNQVGLNSEPFRWSRDIFNDNFSEGAFYVFNDGISLVDQQGLTIYDHQSGHLLDSVDQVSSSKIKLCKAHLQFAYEDYLNK